MKVYLAGKFADCNGPMGEKRDSIIEQGHEITHDWMTFETPSRNHVYKGVMATRDINGVAAADAVIIVMDDFEYSYRGSFTELGAALALSKPVLMVSPGNVEDSAGFKTNVFWHHPSISYTSDWPDALKWLSSMQARGAEEEGAEADAGIGPSQ